MFDLVIIGGGISGLSAAREAATRGCQTLVIDEREKPGGIVQYISREVGAGNLVSRISGSALVEKLLEEAVSAGAKIMPSARVWGLFTTDGAFQVAIEQDGQGYSIGAPALVIATGGYVAPYPFVGWDLPEVLDAYEALSISYSDQEGFPGEKIGIIGATELALLLALQIDERGKGRPFLVPNGDKFNKESELYQEIERKSVDIYEGEISQFADQRLHLTTGDQEVEVDCLVVADRVSPEIEPSFLVGCAIGFREEAGGYFTKYDDSMRTSQKGVFVAGKAAGFNTIEGALLSGKLAGISAANMLKGRVENPTELKKQLKEIESWPEENRRFVTKKTKLPDDFPICHCGYVTKKTVGELNRILEEGAATLDDVKRLTGIGMGPCQQRLCRYPVAQLILDKTGKSMENIGPMKVRVPIRPVTVGVIASSRRSIDEARFWAG
jgi:thioredoxin reductase/bacterioferritin-associated ferredoxin